MIGVTLIKLDNEQIYTVGNAIPQACKQDRSQCDPLSRSVS